MAAKRRIVAIDFGNRNTVLAMLDGNSVVVPVNSSSKRLIPTVVAFSDDSRMIGEDAFYQRVHNRKNTVVNLRRLIGVAYNSSEYEEIEDMCDNTLIEMPNNRFGVDIGGKYGVLYPEQCAAFLFSKILKEHRITDPSLYVSVTPWWTSAHRRSLIGAMQIAGISDVHLVNSTLSSSVSYLHTHRSKFNEDKVPMVFIDFGDSSLSVSVVYISSRTVEVLHSESSNEIGGYKISEKLMEDIFSLLKWDDKNKIRMLKDKLAFQSEIEKLKRNLSINNEITIDIPALEASDEDLRLVYKRETFEKSIQSYVEKFADILTLAIRNSGVDPTTISSVEALGGSSRIPIIKNTISSVLKSLSGHDVTVSQSLNPDECFAHGACTYGALSDSINCKCSYNINDYSVKAINPVKRDGMTFTVTPSSDTEVFVVLERNIPIAEVQTRSMDPIVMTITVDSNMIAHIETNNEVKYYGEFITSEITQLRECEKKMQEWDDDNSRYGNLKNDLESMVYQLKGFIRDSKRFFTGEHELSDAITAADEANQWIYDSTDLKDEKTLNRHINRLKAIITPISERVKGYNISRTAFEDQIEQITKYIRRLQTSEVAENFKDAAMKKLEALREKITEKWEKFETADFVNPDLENTLKSISQALESQSKKGFCEVF